MVTGSMLLLSLAALLPASLGARLGVLLKQRINEQAFRLTILVVILAVSVSGLLKHLLR
jgi:uncharacterized membrane protein YfcA